MGVWWLMISIRIIWFWCECISYFIFFSALAKHFSLGKGLYRQTADFGGQSSHVSWTGSGPSLGDHHGCRLFQEESSETHFSEPPAEGFTIFSESQINTIFEVLLSQIKASLEEEKFKSRRCTTVSTLVNVVKVTFKGKFSNFKPDSVNFVEILHHWGPELYYY